MQRVRAVAGKKPFCVFHCCYIVRY
jgi:hypothetical protein